MVLVSNLSGGKFHYLAGAYPGRLGHLYSPDGWRTPVKWLPYALDNGAYTGFDEAKFFGVLDRTRLAAHKPLWVAVPDAVGDRAKTLELWGEYRDRVAAYGRPLAFVAQDGMGAGDVPPEASVVFIGGSPGWKLRTLETWCSLFPRIHVGRINTERLLWICHDLGVESVDGTGWWHDKQFADLEKYLETSAGVRRRREQMLLEAK